MPNLEAAVQWMIMIANDPAHGYDQEHRYGPDYDCSSFLCAGLRVGGFDIAANRRTSNLRSALTKIGWEVIPLNSARKRGDIVLSEGHHVVTCTSPTQIVHASINELGKTTGGKTGDQTGKEICVRSWYEHTYGWTHKFRWPGGLGSGSSVTPKQYQWIYKERYRQMTQEDMDNNAIVIYIYLSQNYNWTAEAVAAICGNFHVESRLNPNSFQSDDKTNWSGGFGLAQWTPARNYINWAGVDRYYNNGNLQLERLQYEINSKKQYYRTTRYPIPSTFLAFSQSTLSPDYLARAFLYNYERPASYDTADTRARLAEYYYRLFQTVDFTTLGEKPWPLWMYLHYGI